MFDGHFIDDPLMVVSTVPDFEGLGMEPIPFDQRIHLFIPTMTEEQKEKKTQFNLRIGRRIATLRKLAGMSQEQLAERAGLQRTHVSRIEAGKYDVTAYTVQLIAEALGMTFDLIDTRLADLAPLKDL